MLDPTDLRECVIDPTLKAMDMYSPEASDLVLGTGLAESGLRKLRQVGGPARGLFQMEPATEDDIIGWLIDRDARLLRSDPRRLLGFIDDIAGIQFEETPRVMTGNITYAVAMCRLHYWRRPQAIPKTTFGQAEYWKIHYNTRLGKGTPEHYMAAWKHAGLPIREMVA